MWFYEFTVILMMRISGFNCGVDDDKIINKNNHDTIEEEKY